MWKYLKDEQPADGQKCFVCWTMIKGETDYQVGVGEWEGSFYDILYDDGSYGFPNVVAWMPLVFPKPPTPPK